MKNGVKIGLVAAGTLVVGFLGSKLYKYKKIADQLTIDITGFRIHKFIGKIWEILKFQIVFAVDIKFINPTEYDIRLAIPSVKIYFDNALVGESIPDLEERNINAGDVTTYRNMLLSIPVKNLLNLGIAREVFTNKENAMATLAGRTSFKVYAKVNGMELTVKESIAGLGQLGITAGPRNIKDGSKYNYLFPAVTKKQKIIKPDGDVTNVVKSMIKIVDSHSNQTEKIAKKLKTDNLHDTCEKIFDFAYNHMQYKKDTAGVEELRTPARSWFDGQIKFKQQNEESSGVDCDDYAIFVGSILHQLDIPFRFRITKYYGRNYFQHVYVAVPLEDSEEEIVIDPVLDKFNYEKHYSDEKSDFDMSGLFGDTLFGINGINGEDQEVSEIFRLAQGTDFEELDNVDGLGAVRQPEDLLVKFEDGVYNQLLRTRKLVENKPEISELYQNVGQFREMLDQAIKYFHTDKRETVINKLAEIEKQFEDTGFIKDIYNHDGVSIDYDNIENDEDFKPVDGIPDSAIRVDDHCYDGKNIYVEKNRQAYMAGLGALSGFFNKVKKGLKRAGNAVKEKADDLMITRKTIKHWKSKSKKTINHWKSKTKKTFRKVGKGLKKIGKAIAQHNPVTVMVRLGVLAGYRVNIFRLANKISFGYMTWPEAKEWGFSHDEWNDNVRAKDKIENMFHKLGGRYSKFRQAVAKGNRSNRKYKDPARPNALYGGLGEVAAATLISAGISVLSIMATIASQLIKAKQKKKEQKHQRKMLEEKSDILNNSSNNENGNDQNGNESWFQKNKKKAAGIGVGVLALGAGAYYYYNYYNENQK